MWTELAVLTNHFGWQRSSSSSLNKSLEETRWWNHFTECITRQPLVTSYELYFSAKLFRMTSRARLCCCLGCILIIYMFYVIGLYKIIIWLYYIRLNIWLYYITVLIIAKKELVSRTKYRFVQHLILGAEVYLPKIIKGHGSIWIFVLTFLLGPLNCDMCFSCFVKCFV